MADVRLDNAPALIALVASGDSSLADVAAAVQEAAATARELNVFVDPHLTGLEQRAADCQPGPLHGLPIVAKDIFDTRDLPTSGGTRALLGRRTADDAPIVEALREAGAFIAGKNTLHELSFGITSNNACTGPARNPVDPMRIPGGSSGGTAAAVAAGIAPIGLAADTGGSSRIPAALCGIVGYRPTLGRYPGDGILPIAHSRDTAGLVARTVAEIRLVDAVITSAPTPAPDRAPVDLSGLRLGVPSPFWTGLDPDVETVCRAALDRLAQAGVTLVDVDIREVAELADTIGLPLCLYEFPRDLAAYLAREHDDITVEQVCAAVESPDVAGIVQACLSGPVTDAAYADLLEAQIRLQELYAALLTDSDVSALVFPTTPLPAALIGDDETTTLAGEQVPTFATFIRHTNLAGVAGHPGISLPAGHTPAGLPIGIEFDGRIDADEELLTLAEAVEHLLDVSPTSASSSR
ncbi:MAG: amidase family protein [Dermatophilaceae bacterium]